MRKGETLNYRIGEEGINYQGIKTKIVNFRTSNDIDVLFLNDHNEIIKTKYCHFKSGKIKSYSSIIGDKKKNCTGDECEVVGIKGHKIVTIKHSNGTIKDIKREMYLIGRFSSYEEDYTKEKFLYSDEFAPIPNTDGYYADKNGNIFNRKGKLMKPQNISRGYLAVDICKKGNIKRILCHRLIALAFIPNPNKKTEVNHINGIKTDNRVENLEWVTRSENQIHRFKVLNHSHLGEKNTQSKLIGKEVLEIIKLRNEGLTLRELSNRYKVGQSCISNIINGYSWNHITNIKYKNSL